MLRFKSTNRSMPQDKATKLHPRNPHQGRYDFKALCAVSSALKPFVKRSPKGLATIDFANPKAVIALNQALLKTEYGIQSWHIPKGFLCPPIPGRADYIHYLADLLAKHNPVEGKKKLAQRVPKGPTVKVLDIGTGANCIYPILGSQSYGWSFVGTDINSEAIASAKAILHANSNLTDKVKIVQQKEQQSIFKGIIRKHDSYDLTMCNPPFHRSAEEAISGSQRKWQNLKGSHSKRLNFGGQAQELWCQGGELSFLKRMLTESRLFAQQVRFFTTLVSKSENLRPLKRRLKELDATHVEIIQMTQGQKVSRILVWGFC